MEQVYIGFGGNMGDPEDACLRALDALGRAPGLFLRAASSLYRTEPVGMTEQGWFVNGAAMCETRMPPEEVLRALQEIENFFGRVRTKRWGPRTLDLDILLFGDRRVDLQELVIPHPRLHERRFVLVPMVEIAPSLVHPTLGLTMQDLLDRCDPGGQEVKRCKRL